MGTGWLIKPDIFVTAGHCSYDWSHKLGRATEVKAYIGYDGYESEKDPDVQFKHVERIVTTEGWVINKGKKSFDVSFMQVETPFTGITPIGFEETPSQGNLVLGVVGYPGDLKDKDTGEKGAHMYECYRPTKFDLSKQVDTMLEYQIDTFGGESLHEHTYLRASNGRESGNSGSPVLREHDLISIGAHVYGGTFNSASVIGRYGNPYGDYIAAFGLPLPDDALHLIPVTGNRSIVQHSEGPAVPQTPTRTAKSQLTEAEEEGFVDVLRTVASALPAGLELIGAGPIGALAGFVLSAASNITAETVAAESAIVKPATHEGSIERAILAEATLSALQSVQLPPGLEESIYSDMKDTVMKALPVIRKVAPRVMGAMMEPALKIALDSLRKYNQKVVGGAESFEATTSEPFRPTVLYTSAIDQPADHQAEAFLDHLQASLQQNLQESAMDGDSEEGFFDVIKAGARLASKGVLAAVKHGLPILVDVLKKYGGAESFEDQPSSGQTAQLPAADILAQRALVADAALEAVMRLSPQQLKEEGFFDFIGRAIKTIAPIAMKVAPMVAKALNPEVGKIVRNVPGQESTSADDPTMLGSTLPKAAGNQGLSSKRSLHALRDGSAHSNERRDRLDQTGANRSQQGALGPLGSHRA